MEANRPHLLLRHPHPLILPPITRSVLLVWFLSAFSYRDAFVTFVVAYSPLSPSTLQQQKLPALGEETRDYANLSPLNRYIAKHLLQNSGSQDSLISNTTKETGENEEGEDMDGVLVPSFFSSFPIRAQGLGGDGVSKFEEAESKQSIGNVPDKYGWVPNTRGWHTQGDSGHFSPKESAYYAMNNLYSNSYNQNKHATSSASSSSRRRIFRRRNSSNVENQIATQLPRPNYFNPNSASSVNSESHEISRINGFFQTSQSSGPETSVSLLAMSPPVEASSDEPEKKDKPFFIEQASHAGEPSIHDSSTANGSSKVPSIHELGFHSYVPPEYNFDHTAGLLPSRKYLGSHLKIQSLGIEGSIPIIMEGTAASEGEETMKRMAEHSLASSLGHTFIQDEYEDMRQTSTVEAEEVRNQNALTGVEPSHTEEKEANLDSMKRRGVVPSKVLQEFAVDVEDMEKMYTPHEETIFDNPENLPDDPVPTQYKSNVAEETDNFASPLNYIEQSDNAHSLKTPSVFIRRAQENSPKPGGNGTSSLELANQNGIASSTAKMKDSSNSPSVNYEHKDQDVLSILSSKPSYSAVKSFLVDSGAMASFGPERLVRKVRMTVFLPTDARINDHAALLASFADGSSSSDVMDQTKNSLREKLAIQMATTHTTYGKIIFPEKLEVGKPFVAQSRSRQTNITVVKEDDGSITVDGSAKVLNIVKAKNGFIYVIDRVLTPTYNLGPSIIDLLDTNPELEISRELMETVGMTYHLGAIGPVTLFIPSNSAFSNDDGTPIPRCVTDGLKLPENRDVAIKLMLHAIILGEMLTVEDIEAKECLEPLYGPLLDVNNIGYWYEPQHTSRMQPMSVASSSHSVHVSNLYIDGSKVTENNLAVQNGYVHVIDGLLLPPDVDIPKATYWNCIDDHLRKNPRYTRTILEKVDDYESLPDLGFPPGPRPEWVGEGLPRYFPPNTTYWRYRRYQS